MRLAHALMFGAASVTGLLAAHVWDASDRGTALARFLAHDGDGIGRIIEDYGVSPLECSAGRNGDVGALAMAFVTVESFATTRSERWARTLVAYGGAVAGLTTDISAGPGRIRVSTARAALSGAASDRPEMSDLSLVRTLLSTCGAVRTAAQILRRIRYGDGSASSIDLKFIRTAATAYNGQSQRTSSYQAALSAQVYFDLVYAAYQHYRFSAL